jgi:hypothetical protein
VLAVLLYAVAYFLFALVAQAQDFEEFGSSTSAVSLPWCSTSGQSLKSNGTIWQCATPVWAEADPQVGTLTASQWCVANGGGTAIDCTTAAPLTAEADPIATHDDMAETISGLWTFSNGLRFPGHHGTGFTYLEPMAGSPNVRLLQGGYGEDESDVTLQTCRVSLKGHYPGQGPELIFENYNIPKGTRYTTTIMNAQTDVLGDPAQTENMMLYIPLSYPHDQRSHLEILHSTAADAAQMEWVAGAALTAEADPRLPTPANPADDGKYLKAGAGALALSALIIPNGAAPAATCATGEVFIDTDETNDTNCATTADNSLCICTATNTWTALENN